MQNLTLKTDTLTDWTRLNDRANSVIAITRTMNEEYQLSERDLADELSRLIDDPSDAEDALIPFQTMMTLAVNVAFRLGTLHPGYFTSERANVSSRQTFLYAFYSRASHTVEAAEQHVAGFIASLTDTPLRAACDQLMCSGDIVQTAKSLGMRYETLRTRLRAAFRSFVSSQAVTAHG